MPTHNQLKSIKTGICCGICFAGAMALFDYTDRVDFRLDKFLFNFLFFGACMGLMQYRSFKNIAK